MLKAERFGGKHRACAGGYLHMNLFQSKEDRGMKHLKQSHRVPGSNFMGTAILCSVSILVVANFSGCYSSRVLRQSGVIMHPRAPTRSGQNLAEGSTRIYHHSSVLTWMERSESGADNTVANRVSGYVGGGGFRIKLGDNWDIGPLFEVGSSRWTHQMAEKMPPAPPTHRVPFAFGIDISYSVPLSNWFRLAFSMETLLFVMPNQEFGASSCTPDDEFEGCGTGSLDRNSGLGFAISVIPSYRISRRFVLFGGMDLRMMPRFNEEVFVETEGLSTTEHNPLDYEGNVAFGGGAEYSFTENWHLTLSVYQSVKKNPLASGPVIGLVFSVDIRKPALKNAIVPPEPVTDHGKERLESETEPDWIHPPELPSPPPVF